MATRAAATADPVLNLLEQQRAKILVAGAGGAIGTAVCRELSADHDVIALVGSDFRIGPAGPEPAIEWRACEAFSRRDVEAAIAGCEYIVYLVHTRMPTARLDQAACEDLDLLIADNVARASSRHGVKQIVYLGGYVPKGSIETSVHKRRTEVMDALSSYGTPVTALRAGLVVAPGSNAVKLLANAATRLPIVLVPKWALTRKQPIAVSDVIRGIRFCLGNQATYGEQLEIGGPVALNYGDLLRQAADVLHRRPVILAVPLFPPRLYEWYLRLLDRRAHQDLVRLAVEQLRHDMDVPDSPLQRFIANGATLPRDLVAREIEQLGGHLPVNPREAFLRRYLSAIRSRRGVRSIQRLALPMGLDATWVAKHYFQWLPRFTWHLVVCEVDEHSSCRVYNRLPRLLLLELTFQPGDSSPDRCMYFITGGLLARGQSEGRPRLEFRDVLNGRNTIVAIHDFAPQLPWVFYRATQAAIHLVVMRAFQRHMAGLASPSAAELQD
jgi:nucleoside-diphosphate-sugar epimerase